MKLINSTPNGQIFICPRQRIAHIEFGNVFLKLTFSEFNQFVKYVDTITHCYCICKNDQARNKRKLLLKIGFEDLFLALHEQELLELSNLLSLKPAGSMLKCGQIVNPNIQLN